MSRTDLYLPTPTQLLDCRQADCPLVWLAPAGPAVPWPADVWCVGPSQLTACPCCAYTTLHQLAVQAASAGRWVPALGGVLSPWRKVCLAADADTSGGGPVKTGRIQWPGRPEGHRRGWGAGPSSPGTQHRNKLRKICYC